MTIKIRRVVYWALRPVWRLLLRVMPVDDPWERLDYNVPVPHYGLGARHDFDWYFEGKSLVHTQSLDDVQNWLLDCEYEHDEELFQEADFWQHPRTFERLRRGDCEDHALWAWRKLVELGLDAELVSGRRLPWQPHEPDRDRGHVWVIFRQKGEAFLFEAVAKDHSRMIRPLAAVADAYRPEFGVDRNRKRFAFSGVLLTYREREFGIDADKDASAKRTA